MTNKLTPRKKPPYKKSDKKPNAGHANLIPFKKGYDARRNMNGSPRKVISTFKSMGYNMREIKETITALLAMTEDELKHIEINMDCNVLERTMATALLKGLVKGSLYNVETIISRAMGTPNQTTDVNVDNKIEVVFVKGKTIL